MTNAQVNACCCSSPDCARWGCQANRPSPPAPPYYQQGGLLGVSPEATAINNLAEAIRELANAIKEPTP